MKKDSHKYGGVVSVTNFVLELSFNVVILKNK